MHLGILRLGSKSQLSATCTVTSNESLSISRIYCDSMKHGVSPAWERAREGHWVPLALRCDNYRCSYCLLAEGSQSLLLTRVPFSWEQWPLLTGAAVMGKLRLCDLLGGGGDRGASFASHWLVPGPHESRQEVNKLQPVFK